MKNKYYTPKIKDFHVGFEYEYYNPKSPNPTYDNDWELPGTNGEWIKKIFDGSYRMEDSEQNSVEAALANYSFNQTKVRVKYLDEKDVESLGWLPSSTPGFYDFKDNDRFYLSTYNNPIQRVEIEDNENEFEFAGIIKNRSELKKLMEQLGIELAGR